MMNYDQQTTALGYAANTPRDTEASITRLRRTLDRLTEAHTSVRQVASLLVGGEPERKAINGPSDGPRPVSSLFDEIDSISAHMADIADAIARDMARIQSRM